MATPTPKNLYTGTTSGVLYTDRRDFYLKPKSFAELFPNVSPFTTFLMRANFRTGLADPVFKLFEHQAPWQRQVMSNNASTVTIAAAATGAAAESSAVTFDGITGLNSSIDESYVHLIFEVWDSTGTTKKGVCICTDDTSTTTAKFRNLGGTAIATVDNDLFVCIGNAQEEGVVAPEAWADELVTVWNQTQIHRTPIEITGSLAQASLRGANKELARLRADKMAEHKIQIEKSLLFGSSPLGTNLSAGDTFTDLDKLVGDNSKVVRTTVGLIRALELYGNSTAGNQYQSVFALGAATTYGDLVDALEVVFQYVPISGMKDTFLGAGALGWWSKRAMEKNSGFVINQDSAERNIAGQKVRTLVTPHGDLNLVLTHSMKFEHKNQMLIADPGNLEYVQFRPSKFAANIKTDDGYDGVKDEYFSDSGIGITNIKAHQLFNIEAG
jgi:hypothetical protein